MREHDLQLIRLYCDGELSKEARHAFEARLATEPELASRLAHERRLQSHLAAMLTAGAVAAPAALRERIQIRMAQEVVEEIKVNEAPARQLRPTPSLRWVFRPRQANFWAIAASLALVSFVVIWGIYAPQIDQAGIVTQADFSTQAAMHASEEHNCARNRNCRSQKIVYSTREEAAFDLSKHLGVDRVIVFDLSDAGYEFLGEGHCRLPGPQPSAHLIYGRDAGERGTAIVSIFVAANNVGQFGCRKQARSRPGEWRQVDGGPQCQKMVMRTMDCSLAYFLVCCDGSDTDSVSRIIATALADAK